MVYSFPSTLLYNFLCCFYDFVFKSCNTITGLLVDISVLTKRYVTVLGFLKATTGVSAKILYYL
jgi:hypothetical protein